MPVIDALKILQQGRELRGTIELDEALLTWRARFDGRGHIAVDLDEIGLDDPIPVELTQDGQ